MAQKKIDDMKSSSYYAPKQLFSLSPADPPAGSPASIPLLPHLHAIPLFRSCFVILLRGEETERRGGRRERRNENEMIAAAAPSLRRRAIAIINSSSSSTTISHARPAPASPPPRRWGTHWHLLYSLPLLPAHYIRAKRRGTEGYLSLYRLRTLVSPSLGETHG